MTDSWWIQHQCVQRQDSHKNRLWTLGNFTWGSLYMSNIIFFIIIVYFKVIYNSSICDACVFDRSVWLFSLSIFFGALHFQSNLGNKLLFPGVHEKAKNETKKRPFLLHIPYLIDLFSRYQKSNSKSTGLYIRYKVLLLFSWLTLYNTWEILGSSG